MRFLQDRNLLDVATESRKAQTAGVYLRGLMRKEVALPRASLAMDKFDIIVIGSGPAGQRAAIQAAKFGKKPPLVEKMEMIGGAATNTGTIPSQTIRASALQLSRFYYQPLS